MEGVRKLLREQHLVDYVQRHNLSDAMEAVIAGLIVLRPLDPCEWCIQSLARLEDMPGYSVTWDCLIPANKRPGKRIRDAMASGYLDEIFRLGTMRHIPAPEQFEIAYNHYYSQLKVKCWKAWFAFKTQQIAERKLMLQRFAEAREYHRVRRLRIIITSWRAWTVTRVAAATQAEQKLRNVWSSYYQHTVITHWQTTVADAILTRRYFEKLENESSTLDAEALEYLGIELYRDPISVLPHKVATQIFSYLNLLDLGTCQMVCRSWKILTSAPSLWSHLDFYRVRHRFNRDQSAVAPLIQKWRAYLIHLNLRCQYNLEPSALKLIGGCKNLQDLNLSECNGVTDHVIKLIVEGCTGLRYLNLSHTSLSDVGLKDIGRFCTALQYLSIASCPRFTERGVHSLSMGKCGRKLTYLDMSNCPQVALQGYHSIAKGLVNLQTLVLNGNYPLQDNAVIIMVQKLGKLKTLKLQKCTNLSDHCVKFLGECRTLTNVTLEENHRVSDASIKVVAKYCPNIVDLALIDCIRLTDVSMKGIAQLQYLKTLDISDCSKISDFGIRYLGEGPAASKLQNLDLTNVARISDLSIFRIAKSCTALKKLSLAYCEHLSDTGIEQLDVLHHLKKLDLTGTQVTDDTLGKLGKMNSLANLIIAECPEVTGNGVSKFCTRISHRLESFDVSHCKELTDNSMKNLAYNCRKIKNLNLAGCWRLTDATVYGIASSCPLIETFDISGCYYMTDDVLRHFKKLKRLTLLVMKFCRNITAVGYHQICSHVPEVYYDHDDAPKWFRYAEIPCLANMAIGSIKATRRPTTVSSRKSTAKSGKRSKKNSRPSTGKTLGDVLAVGGSSNDTAGNVDTDVSTRDDLKVEYIQIQVQVDSDCEASESDASRDKNGLALPARRAGLSIVGGNPAFDRVSNILEDVEGEQLAAHSDTSADAEEELSKQKMVTKSFSLTDGTFSNFTHIEESLPEDYTLPSSSRRTSNAMDPRRTSTATGSTRSSTTKRNNSRPTSRGSVTSKNSQPKLGSRQSSNTSMKSGRSQSAK